MSGDLSIRGIDLSKWQSSTPSLTGMDFVIARASIGTTADERFAQHIGKARAAGAVTGAYHFNWRTGASPEEQARFFVAKAGAVDLLFLDVEGDQAFTADQSKRFIAEVHRLGRKCGLYMSASVYRWTLGQDYHWIAKWGSTPPNGAWDFWQYTSDGKVSGYTGRLDLNYFNGSLAELRALAGGSEMPLEYANDTVKKVVIPPETVILRSDGSRLKTVHESVTKVSPLGVKLNGSGYRVIDASDGDRTVVALVKSSEVTAEAIDAITKADLDAAVAAATATLQAQLAAAQVEAANAATTERERIAAAEAARLEAI
jgi:hypothetical protein